MGSDIQQLNGIHAGLLRLGLGLTAAIDRLRSTERGAVMAEYGLLLMVALLAAFAIVALFGEAVLGLFEDAHTDFTDAYENGSGNTP